MSTRIAPKYFWLSLILQHCHGLSYYQHACHTLPAPHGVYREFNCPSPNGHMWKSAYKSMPVNNENRPCGVSFLKCASSEQPHWEQGGLLHPPQPWRKLRKEQAAWLPHKPQKRTSILQISGANKSLINCLWLHPGPQAVAAK